MYFEEDYYQAGHFQSIVPTRENEILRSIKQRGGFDVCDFLAAELGEFITVLLLMIDFILSF